MLKRKKPEAEKTETLRGRLPGSFWKKGESKLSQERKDRLFLVSRRPEAGVAIIALLTAFFECGGAICVFGTVIVFSYYMEKCTVGIFIACRQYSR